LDERRLQETALVTSDTPLRSAVLLALENLLFTVLVPGTVAGYVPYQITRSGSLASGGWLLLGGALFLLGVAIYAWCVWDFASFGRGTPAPIDAPKRLVVRGLYRYSRNPMYVGVLSVVLGWSAAYADLRVLAYAAFVLLAFSLFVRLYEEPHLEREFGDEYREYRGRVGRWLTGPRG
jgi:protein-S-isoprenylcysteine O-methyltransferase Ste14